MADPKQKPVSPAPDQPNYGDQPWQNPEFGSKKRSYNKQDGREDEGCGCAE